MKINIGLFKKLYKSYGLINGSVLFGSITLGNTQNLHVPNIKYPITLRKNTSDLKTFHQIFFKSEYLLKLPYDPKIIIDGGANIGLFAIEMKNKYPDVKIICIEPDKDNFETLKKNVSSYNDIYCENCGIWNNDTMLKVYDKFNFGKWGMVVEEDLISGNINALSINTIFKKYDIKKLDILKLDIETSEKQLFSNNFENWLPKVSTLIIELHDWMESGCSKPFFEAINKTYANYDYSISGENTVITNKGV